MSVQQADQAARRTAVVLLLFAAAAGLMLIFGASLAQPTVQAWVEQDLRPRLTIVVVVMMIFAAGPPLGLALYLWRFGSRVIAASRFPPPDMRVVKDTAIITGESARSRGRVMRIFAAMIAGGALLILGALVRLALLVWMG
jgi:hypothetical protein